MPHSHPRLVNWSSVYSLKREAFELKSMRAFLKDLSTG